MFSPVVCLAFGGVIFVFHMVIVTIKSLLYNAALQALDILILLELQAHTHTGLAVHTVVFEGLKRKENSLLATRSEQRAIQPNLLTSAVC